MTNLFKHIVMAVEFTDSNFEEVALKSGKPVMVDFWAEGVDLAELWGLLWRSWRTITMVKLSSEK